MIFRVIERAKEGNSLDMVQVEVTEEDMSFDRPAGELFFEFFSEQTYTRSAVQNEDLGTVRSQLDTGGIASETHVFLLRCWRGTTNSPESRMHSKASPEKCDSIVLAHVRLQESCLGLPEAGFDSDDSGAKGRGVPRIGNGSPAWSISRSDMKSVQRPRFSMKMNG